MRQKSETCKLFRRELFCIFVSIFSTHFCLRKFVHFLWTSIFDFNTIVMIKLNNSECEKFIVLTALDFSVRTESLEDFRGLELKHFTIKYDENVG